MIGHDLVELSNGSHGATYAVVAFFAKQFRKKDWDALHSIGERAARDAGVDAFWVSTQCLDHSDPFEVSRRANQILQAGMPQADAK